MSVEEKWRANISQMEDNLQEAGEAVDSLDGVTPARLQALMARMLFMQNAAMIGHMELILDCHRERMERDA